MDDDADKVVKEGKDSNVDPKKVEGDEKVVEGKEDQLVVFLSRIREALGLLSPEEVKAKVRDDISKLPGSVPTLADFSAALGGVFSKHEPEGLKALYVANAEGNTADIVAEASDPSLVGSALDLNAKARTGMCFLFVRINDQQVGDGGEDRLIWNDGDGGKHAEENLEIVLPKLISGYRQRFKDPPTKVDIIIRYSPCLNGCSPVLSRMKSNHPEIKEWNIIYLLLYQTDDHPKAFAEESIKRLTTQGILIRQVTTRDAVAGVHFGRRSR